MTARPDPKTWTCRRQRDGSRCNHRNPTLKRNCLKCGQPRQRRVNKHKQLLDAARPLYDELLAVQGGVCPICLRPPSGTRKFNLDHDHKRLRVRGVIDHRCNRALPSWITPEWLRAAADYLEHPPAERLTKVAA